MLDKITEMVWEKLEPKVADVVEEAYKKGAEDTIRRFAFVYDTIAKSAKEDAYAEAGAIPIEEITKEQYEEMVS